MNSTAPLSPQADNVLRKPGTRTSAMFFMFIGVLPFLVETVPWSRPVPLSAYLLPEFLMMFAAVYLCGWLPGLLIGLAVPLMRGLSSNFAAPGDFSAACIELCVFGLLAHALMAKSPRASWIAPLALVLAKAIAVAAHAFLPGVDRVAEPLSYLISSLQVGTPGFLILGFVNFCLIRLCPPPDDWDAY